MVTKVKPDGRGRLLLPQDAREALGLGERQEVAVELRSDGSVVLRDPAKVRAAALRSLRGASHGHGGSVDELLEDRRREAELEASREERLGGRS